MLAKATYSAAEGAEARSLVLENIHVVRICQREEEEEKEVLVSWKVLWDPQASAEVWLEGKVEEQTLNWQLRFQMPATAQVASSATQGKGGSQLRERGKEREHLQPHQAHANVDHHMS